jgi:hypothetical protein
MYPFQIMQLNILYSNLKYITINRLRTILQIIYSSFWIRNVSTCIQKCIQNGYIGFSKNEQT